MRNTHFPISVLAAALSACATESVILNSERIAHRFGSYGIEVLASEAGLRRSSLFSYDGDTVTCRTYAVVQFEGQHDEYYDDEHSKVLAGNSIGATFKENGWGIRKDSMYIGSIRLPQSRTEVGELMRLTGAHDLALHVYRLVLVREGVAFDYATILEVHHPEYLSEQDLRGLFEYEASNELPATDLQQLSALVFGV
ncbi:MAG: hypothetical protein KC572_01070 [Gammaproteobacteria bacterium]|nr:hypothetical protein [Gammaproteobacteria bacterium]